jgi:hypothetical protein
MLGIHARLCLTFSISLSLRMGCLAKQFFDLTTEGEDHKPDVYGYR